MKALILSDTVVQVAKDSFPVAPELTWIDCPDEVIAGWRYEQGGFLPPIPHVSIFPQGKSETDLKMDALIKAVLTGDKQDLENLNNK
jgi:hypothetical protein